jgi:heparanase 1
LVFGLNEIHGRNCHVNGTHCTGNWDTSNVEAFLTYIRDHQISPILGFELGNELTNSYDPHLTIQQNIEDYNNLNKIISQIWTNPQTRPGIYGPSTDYCNADTATFMQGTKDFLKAFSYHSYPGQSGSQLTTQLININWLKENIILQDPHAHSQACITTWQQIGKPAGMQLWITETNSAYRSVPGVMNGFYNGFWYLSSLGQYSKTGVSRHSLWALESGDDFTFVNISKSTLSVLPDYWVAVLYKRLIGNKVLQATSAFTESLVYAYCGKPVGSVVLIVVNPSPGKVTLNLTGLNSIQRNEYIFTADSLDSYVSKLNGKELYINSDGSLPEMPAVPGSGQPVLPPYSYGYLDFPNGGPICK